MIDLGISKIALIGAVALIVKMDDIGLHLAERRSTSARARHSRAMSASPSCQVWRSTCWT